MDDWELYNDIGKELGELKSRGFGEFVHSNGKGAIHSIEFPGDATSINTAALLRILQLDRSYCKDCTDSALEVWRKQVLIPDLEEQIVKLKPGEPKTGEYEAYRVAQILRAVSDDRGNEALRDWLLAYVQKWLSQEDKNPISVFLVYLCADALGYLSETGHGHRAQVPGPILRFAEIVVSKQVSIGASELRTDLDAIDLALALSMGASSLAPGIINVSLDLLNKAVAHEGLWTNRQPILRFGHGRGVGCSAFEACVALLAPRRLSNPFTTLRIALISHLGWLRDNRKADAPWEASDLYLREPNRETWFNCLLAEFLASLLERLDESKQSELRMKYRAKIVDKGYEWDEMILGDEEKSALHESFISPLKGATSPPKLERCTALLFGPPGTTKTTIAETIAKELSWPFIELGVADFLRDGLDRVFAAAIDIFADLLRLQNVVVLLDEVEGVFAERTEKESDLRQKFLTSALLPPLKRVKQRGRIVLLIATNHVREFDQAIRRLGRIDLIVGVGPPEQQQRETLLQKLVGLPDDVSKRLAELLPEQTTIAEIKWLKRIPMATGGGAGDVAMELFSKWKARFDQRQEIDGANLDEFKKQRREFSRLD